MTGWLEEIKREFDRYLDVRIDVPESGVMVDLKYLRWLITEVERLRGAIEAYFNFAPGGYVMWEKLTNELREKDTTIATLREAITKYLNDPEWETNILTEALAPEAPT